MGKTSNCILPVAPWFGVCSLRNTVTRFSHTTLVVQTDYYDSYLKFFGIALNSSYLGSVYSPALKSEKNTYIKLLESSRGPIRSVGKYWGNIAEVVEEFNNKFWKAQFSITILINQSQSLVYSDLSLFLFQQRYTLHWA